jgi:two-component system sensor kinase FixL
MDGNSQLPNHDGTDALGGRDGSLFRTLIHTTRNGVLVADRDGLILVYNEACEQLFRYTPAEVLGGPLDLLLSPPYRALLRDTLRAAAAICPATPCGIEREVQGLKKDRSLFPMQLVIGPGELGGKQVFLAVVHDLTSLYREREALDEEKSYLAQIVESSSDAIVSYLLDGTVRSWNHAAEEMFGYRAEEIVGAAAPSLMPQFVPPEMIPAEMAVLKRVLAGEKVLAHESIRLHRDGTPVHVLLTASPIRDASGAVIGIARTVRDITERKKLEAERQAREQDRALLDLAIDNSDDGFAYLKLDGSNFTWSRGLSKMLGYEHEEIEGLNASVIIPRIVPPELQAEEFEFSRRAAKGEKIGPYETVRVRKDGVRLKTLSTVYPVRNDKGEVVAIARTLHDLTNQHAFEAQRSLLSAIIDSSTDAIISYALDGTITSWNRAAEQMYGYKADEMIGTSLYGRLADFMPPEQVSEERRIVARVISGERVPPYEATRIRKDGSQVHVLVSVSPIKDATGDIVGTSRVVRDITERKVFERQRALLSAAVDSSMDSISTYDLDGTITSWNPAAELATGRKAREMIGKNFFTTLASILPPEKIAEERNNVARVVAGERVAPYEIVRRRDDGGEANVLISISPIKDTAGKIIGVSRIARDITERKVFERQQALLSSIVESSNDAVFTKTLNGVVTSWNAAAEAMFGYNAKEIAGRSMLVLVPEELLEEERISLERIRNGGTIRHFETLRRKKDGTIFPVSLTLSPVRDAEGTVTGASATIRDITDRKNYEQRLESMREDMIHVARVHELSQVSAGIAHELNQPLAAMLNYSNVARRLVQTGGDLTKLPEVAGKIGDQAERAAQIIRRMRDFVEKRDPHRTVVDLSLIAEDAIALALIGSKTANIETQVIQAGETMPVLADRVQIQQVLVNLLRNAAEAMANAERRQLTLSIDNGDGRMVVVSVADTGIGLSDDVAGRLFSPFVTTKPDGMGIGLAISKQIIEAHGGTMAVRPNPGGGTVFEFTLPAADQSSTASSSA